MSRDPIVVVSKIVPTPSRRAYGGVDLRGRSGAEIAHFRSYVLLLDKLIEDCALRSPRIKVAERAVEATTESAPCSENFPHEAACQKIVLAFAKEHYGYDHPKKKRRTIPLICETTDLQGCSVCRDTVSDILKESAQRANDLCDFPNREKSYHKLIYAFACQHYGDDAGRLPDSIAGKIEKLTRDRRGPVAVEIVREILKAATAQVAPDER